MRVHSKELKKLEARVDDLIDVCERLKNDNGKLRNHGSELEDEHDRLLDKTKQARSRIKSMIDRLKALESGQS